MFMHERDFNAKYRGRRGVDETKKVYADVTSFEDYVERNKENFMKSFSQVVA